MDSPWNLTIVARQSPQEAIDHAKVTPVIEEETRTMTELLEKAFAEAAKLPEQDQNSVATWILAELESEQKWDEAFSRSANQLAKLAAQALQEHAEGRTQELDPDRL
jgi:hypothetical protein